MWTTDSNGIFFTTNQVPGSQHSPDPQLSQLPRFWGFEIFGEYFKHHD